MSRSFVLCEKAEKSEWIAFLWTPRRAFFECRSLCAKWIVRLAVKLRRNLCSLRACNKFPLRLISSQPIPFDVLRQCARFGPNTVASLHLALKNRLIPLWHAICGWVIDLDFPFHFTFFFLTFLTAKNFSSRNTKLLFAAAWRRKVFLHPSIFKLFPIHIECQSFLFANCFLLSNSLFLMFPSSNVTFLTKRILITITKKNSERGKKFNAISLHSSSPLTPPPSARTSLC